MKLRVALYCRVSRDDLNNDNQKRLLLDRVHAEQWEYELFEEKESTRKTRPIKYHLMQQLRNHEFSVLLFTRLDRFARSLFELVQDVTELVEQHNIRVIVLQQGFDFQKDGFNALSRLQLQLLGAFAEFERELIRERTLEGLARARAQGRVGGRPRKTPPDKLVVDMPIGTL